MKEKIRKIVKRTLLEKTGGARGELGKYFFGADFPYGSIVSTGSPYFPYEDDPSSNTIIAQPEFIKPNLNYLANYDKYEDNQGMYKFPFEEFKRGLKIEVNINPSLDIIEVAKKVLENLRYNKYFYTELINSKDEADQYK